MTQALWSHKVRYGLTAALCLLLNNFILIAANAVGLSIIEATVAAFCIMVVIGYLLLANWTYSVKRSWQAFLLYVVAMAFNFPINLAVLWLLVHVMGKPMVIAAPIASVSISAINFFSSYWTVAGGHSDADPAR
jgi:putative flippase GtrA